MNRETQLHRGRNRIAMENCEKVAVHCIAAEWILALSHAYDIQHWAEFGRIDIDIWYPLLAEALDLHRRRPATMPPWAAS